MHGPNFQWDSWEKRLANCTSKFFEEQKFLNTSWFSKRKLYNIALVQNCIHYFTKVRKGQLPIEQRGLCELLIHADHVGVHKTAFCDSILPEHA